MSILELNICEGTVSIVPKSILRNASTAEKVVVVLKPGKSGFSRLHIDINRLGGERCYSRLTSIVNTVLSQTFNHKICFIYAIRRQLSVVSF